jgi:hypothetical protein
MRRTPLLLPAVLYGILSTLGAMPARAQDSNGPSPIGFLDTSSYPYDYLVDSSLSQDDPASRKFRTVQAAYAAAPEGTAAKPTVIGIRPDVYHIAGTATEPGMTIRKNYITLLGLTNDHRNVVLADNRGNQQGASNNGYIIIVNATGFTVINLTILNYCNVNYEYPGDPRKNLTARSNVITQAVALQASGDQHVCDHVALLSRLDTTFIPPACRSMTVGKTTPARWDPPETVGWTAIRKVEPRRDWRHAPEVRMWEATLQSEGLRQCLRERYFNVYGLLGRMLPGLEGQQAFFDGGEPLGGGGVGGFQADHAGEVAAGEGFDAASDFALHAAHDFNGAVLGGGDDGGDAQFGGGDFFAGDGADGVGVFGGQGSVARSFLESISVA